MARTDWKRIVFLGGLGIVIVAGLVRLFSNDAGPVPEAMTVDTEQVLDILPHDTQFAMMLDAQEIYRHEEYVPRGMFPSKEDFSTMMGSVGELGFDPISDLERVYVGFADVENKRPSVVVAVVDFDEDQIKDFIAESIGDHVVESTYHGATVYTVVDGGQMNWRGSSEMAFALVKEELIIVASSEADVQDALDRWGGEAPGMSANAESMKLLSQVAHAESGWVMMREMGAELRPEGRGDMERFARRLGRALRDAVVGFIMDDEGIEANIVLTPRSSVEAEDLASVAKGVLAGMKGMVDSDAQLQILDDVKIKASGNKVKAHFFVDYETLNALR